MPAAYMPGSPAAAILLIARIWPTYANLNYPVYHPITTLTGFPYIKTFPQGKYGWFSCAFMKISFNGRIMQTQNKPVTSCIVFAGYRLIPMPSGINGRRF